ncbi:MAG: error-prone DNA polymerase [Pirellulaceae bacterium]
MYAELHCKSNFTFLEGASHADELVKRAAELEYAALAVTDTNSLAGIVRAHRAAKEAGLKLIVGAEITLADGPAVIFWATDRAAYGRLSRLITVGRRRAEKGQCRLALEDLATHQEGLLAGVVPPPLELQSAEQATGALEQLHPYREIFGDRGYLLAELHRGPDDARQIEWLRRLSRESSLPLVAAGDVHYHVPTRMALQDVLTAIRHGVTVTEAGSQLFPNAQRHLKPYEEIAATFTRIPHAIRRTREIADRCTFSLDQLRYEYPEELAPRGLTPIQYLCQLSAKGARKRYPNGVSDKIQAALQHELTLIEELHYEAYFLTVWDLVRFARHRGILCQGRGSAANSAVCYCLGITSVDPDRMDLLFERFVSRERNEAPDIDVDFEHERREEVLQYLYRKYGRDRAGLTAVVITYRSRSAIRDVGKALGLSRDRVDALAKLVEGYADESKLAARCRQAGMDPESEIGRRLIYLVNELTGFPRHLSQHVGGMVITRGPLCELAPIENAAMEDRTVIQWDKDDLDELGILKVDCLALGMLTAIRKCFDSLERHSGRKWTLANIPAGDPEVYDMVCRADTVGVFQIESRAQMSMLPRLKPRCYYDLVIEVAIVRPGPIQGQMVHPYLRRRAGKERVTYPNREIRDVLHKTLGVPIFQEQAMRLAVVAAGFTPGEADQLRRAMGAWRRPGLIDRFHRKLIDGMLHRGLSPIFAEQVFQQIRGFGEYGFPESHAASFALLVYVSAWLKRYYPAAFAAALINSQPMGFYAPAQLLRDTREHGVTVRPVDVNFSNWDCTLEEFGIGDLEFGMESSADPDKDVLPSPIPNSTPNDHSHIPKSQIQNPKSQISALRLGFRLVSGLRKTAAETMERARRDGPFRSIEDFTRRTRLSRTVIVRLAQADAFQSLNRHRRSALWEALSQEQADSNRPLLAALDPEDEPSVPLPEMLPQEEVFADYRTCGLSLKAHPLSFHRADLDRLRILPAARLATIVNHRQVRVAGLVLLRQRPSTAKGITFVTLEDETGTANLVVHQTTWDRYYDIARCSPAWIAHGRLESKDSIIHVVVNRLEDLSRRLEGLQTQSRNFR